jgi:hypothetical protein
MLTAFLQRITNRIPRGMEHHRDKTLVRREQPVEAITAQGIEHILRLEQKFKPGYQKQGNTCRVLRLFDTAFSLY